MTNMVWLAYASMLKVEEAGREEVVLHTYDFYPDAWIMVMASACNVRSVGH
jgi:hypothetical protein